MTRALHTVRRASARRAMRPALGVAVLTLLGACGHQATVETGLNRDVALADQLQRRNAPALVSAQELSPAAAPAARQAPEPAPVVHTTVVYTPVVHRRVVTRSVATAVHHATGGEVVATEPAPSTERSGSVRDGGYDTGTYGADVQSSAASSAASAPTYRQQPQAHAVRDGVFGSIAGAIIGAAASHGDRVRGGLIGAVAGGALGAVYGHSVDRTYADVQSAYPTYRSYSGYRRAPRYRGTI